MLIVTGPPIPARWPSWEEVSWALSRTDDGTMLLDVLQYLNDQLDFEPWLTGREVVQLAQRLAGRNSADRLDEVIAQSGLREAADRRVWSRVAFQPPACGLTATARQLAPSSKDARRDSASH
jgi:hypothetical protein